MLEEGDTRTTIGISVQLLRRDRFGGEQSFDPIFMNLRDLRLHVGQRLPQRGDLVVEVTELDLSYLVIIAGHCCSVPHVDDDRGRALV